MLAGDCSRFGVPLGEVLPRLHDDCHIILQCPVGASHRRICFPIPDSQFPCSSAQHCCCPAQERPIDCASQYESEEYIVFVKDTSSNGTFVNGKRIGNQNKIAIKHGDVVAVTQKRGSGLLPPRRRAYGTAAKSPFVCSTAAAWCYYPRTWSLRLRKAMHLLLPTRGPLPQRLPCLPHTCLSRLPRTCNC